MARLLRSLFAMCALFAATAAQSAIPPAVIAPEIEVVRAEFGLFGAPESDEPAFTPTDVVPHRENQRYGWIVLLKTNKSRIRWREEFTLPSPPGSWGDAEPQGVRTLSPDRTTAVTEREVTPDQGLIYNAWSVAPGDPVGRHEMRVIIEGAKEIRFEFEVR